jgi:hypothetical protein
MIIKIIVVILIIISVIIGYFLFSKKNTCSCIGKSCSDSDGCGNPCCGDNAKCINGTCCSTDCSGKNCGETNGCGDLCNFCKRGTKCVNGNCISNDCTESLCDDNCPCPNNQICYQGTCCTPQNCSDGSSCGGSGVCGQPPCQCNDRYCGSGILGSGDCCTAGSCTYNDVCNGPAGLILAASWGKFCSKDVNGSPVCTKCNLINPIFENNSLAPISGKIECESCLGTRNISVNIDTSVGSYIPDVSQNNYGNLIPVSNICKDDCNNCVCVMDSDCQRFGCNKCVGNSCV